MVAAAAHGLVIAAVGGRDAGVGALAVSNELALLFAAGVVPELRRRGVHRALLQARLDIARARGATLAMLKTPAGSSVERAAAELGFARTGLRRRVTRTA
jgi:GNAT superfamily N-acetyltransferase